MNAGLSGEANAEDEAGDPVDGLLPSVISSKPILTKIDDNGKVVPLSQQEKLSLKVQEAEAAP